MCIFSVVYLQIPIKVVRESSDDNPAIDLNRKAICP